MNSFIAAIDAMDPSSFWIVVVLSIMWAYLLYEMLDSWLFGAFSAPLFIVASLFVNFLLEKAKFFITGDSVVNAIFATCIGCVAALAGTLIAIRMLMAISTSNLKAKQP